MNVDPSGQVRERPHIRPGVAPVRLAGWTAPLEHALHRRSQTHQGPLAVDGDHRAATRDPGDGCRSHAYVAQAKRRWVRCRLAPGRVPDSAASISVSIDGEIRAPSRIGGQGKHAPPEPLDPPATPAALAAPIPTAGRILNPRSVAMAAAVIGVAVAGVVAMRSAGRRPARAAPPSPIPVVASPPASAPSPPIGPAPSAENRTAVAGLPPKATAPAAPPARSLRRTSRSITLPPRASGTRQDSKHHHQPRRVPRDENGFPIIE